ncbi:MAG: Hydantoin utilization protein A [Thermoanaerobacterales bacterium 50_218]|nr:MAG: Hydantoin utilization protein A [Thermoanaerobacterales bacterium 50_218]HAA89934.1 hydantoinase [Peptococcaceae bacterium]
MIIGIDVGGTYTDGVVIDKGEILDKVKIPTKPEDLLSSLLEALEQLIKASSKSEIERIVLSTTLITNLIATKQIEPVALVLIPGPGINPAFYNFGVPDVYVLSGAIDYRGREIEPLKEKEIQECVEAIRSRGIKRVAVVGKFSQRNNTHERTVAEYFAKNAPEIRLVMGHKVSSRLNFPRRVVTSLLTLATQEKYQNFYLQVKKALEEEKVDAPIYILKADGGTLPFEQSLKKPVETIFSGPAASTLGVLALTPPEQTSIVLDVGGTTTDLALILSGKPLLASRGACVDSYLTHVRAFATKSVPLGGDSVIEVRNGNLEILQQREGPAYCLGGPQPTPTDAMRVVGLTHIGDLRKAREALTKIGNELHLSPEKTAELILENVTRKIVAEIQKMFLAWEQEPAYRVWELLQEKKVRPQNIVGIGAAAPALIPLIGKKMGCQAVAPPHAEVANAIGAALAKVTLCRTYHFDTHRNFYFVEESGVQEKLPKRLSFLSDAEELAFSLLKKEGQELGIPSDEKPELVYSEMFNMVRGWRTIGRLFDVCVQFPPGILRSHLQRGDSGVS